MIENFIKIVMTVSSGAAIFLNVLLFPLIALRSGKEMGSYKYLLLLYTAVAVVNASALMTMRPVLYPSEFGWLFYATFQVFPREIGSYVICIFSICYIVLALVLTYSFIYRYFVLCRPADLRWFNEPKRVLILVLFSLFVLLMTAIPVILYMRLHPDIIEPTTVVDLNEVSYIGAPVWKNGSLVPMTVLILAGYSAVIDLSGATIIFCIVKIVQFFRSYEAALNPRTRSQQKRLFMLLILQTLVPLIFSYTPGLVGYGMAIFQMRGSMMSDANSVFIPLAQLFEPILIISFVAEYRRALWKVCTLRGFELSFVSRSTNKNAVGAVYSQNSATSNSRQEPNFSSP